MEGVVGWSGRTSGQKEIRFGGSSHSGIYNDNGRGMRQMEKTRGDEGMRRGMGGGREV